MSRQRILYILGSLAANDVGDEVIALLGRLSRSHFEPVIVTLGGRGELRHRVEEMKIRLYSLGLVGPFGTVRAVGKVRGLVRQLGVDLVHGYGSWGGAVAQLAAPDDVAVVRTVTRPPNHERDLRGRLLRHLEGRARSRVATRFVVPNAESIGLAVRAYGAADGHVSVLPTSVDVASIRDHVRRTTREHAREQMGIGPEETAFVLLTGFESGARMDDVLEGFQRAARARPGLHLFVVGSGRYESSTRWKAEELGLADAVSFLGGGSDSGPIWAAADLAIDASSWGSWSRTALFAIAAGVPTVKLQADVAGWAEELDEHLPMISGSPERFAADLERLAATHELRAEIGRHGDRVLGDVDVVAVAGRLADLYRSLLN